LRELAGCDYQHLVYDNGSKDGTADWLRKDYAPDWLITSEQNDGISKALNALLGHVDADVVVKFDNDCEVITEGVLRDAAELVYANPKWLLSPQILGLNSPPPVERETELAGHRIGITGLIGGIFLAANSNFYSGFRHDEGNPLWGMDDVHACERMKRQGGQVGYLLDHRANHYETTEGQKATFPDYWVRKEREFYGL
jgi:glycosyltransferase involved in cell wall biosynthesis